MKPGTLLNLVKVWSHRGETLVMDFKLGKKCTTKVLLLELEHKEGQPFDLDAAMAKIGYVKRQEGAAAR